MGNEKKRVKHIQNKTKLSDVKQQNAEGYFEFGTREDKK